MTQTKAVSKTGPIEISAPVAHKGLFLVKPAELEHDTQRIKRQSRSLGLLALAAAALAAPLLWIAHSLLHTLHIR